MLRYRCPAFSNNKSPRPSTNVGTCIIGDISLSICHNDMVKVTQDLLEITKNGGLTVKNSLRICSSSHGERNHLDRFFRKNGASNREVALASTAC